MRISGLVVLLAVGLWTAGAATNEVELTPEYITELSDQLQERNPLLGAARARTNAAGAAVKAVPTWEDPMASVGGMAAERMMRQEDGDLFYGVEQKLPLFGRPQAERRMLNAEFETRSAELDYEYQRLRSELAQALFATARESESIRIAEQDLAWLDTMVLSMDSRYRANQATLPEVLQLQNERARRATELETSRARLRQQESLLGRYVNQPPEKQWPIYRLPQIAPPVPYTQKLIDLAFRYEPRINVLQKEIRVAGEGVNVARKKRLPEVSVGVEARNYTGDGSFRQAMGVVSMSLPWFNAGKYKQEVRRGQALQDAAEMELADYKLELRQDVHQLTVRIDAARREALLYRDDIIPRSETALSSARSSWESGRGGFRDVLDARRMLLESRLMLVRAIAEQYTMLSELVLCCGLGDMQAIFDVVPNLSANQPPQTK